MCKDIGGYDVKYDEFQEMCRKAWSEKFNHLCINMTNKMKVIIVFLTKGRTYVLNAIPKVNLFSFSNVVPI